MAGFEGAQTLAFIAALVWFLHGHKLHQFVTLDEGQPPCTIALQLCTLCEHAVIANLVNPIKVTEYHEGRRLRTTCKSVFCL